MDMNNNNSIFDSLCLDTCSKIKSIISMDSNTLCLSRKRFIPDKLSTDISDNTKVEHMCWYAAIQRIKQNKHMYSWLPAKYIHDMTDSSGSSLYMYGLVYRYKYISCLLTPCIYKYTIYGVAPIELTLMIGNYKLINWLYLMGMDLSGLYSNSSSVIPYTPIELACLTGRVKAAKLILSYINEIRYTTSHPIELAIRSGNISLVHTLYENTIAPSWFSNNLSSLMKTAMGLNYTNIVRFIIHKFEKQIETSLLTKILIYGINHKNYYIIKYIVKRICTEPSSSVILQEYELTGIPVDCLRVFYMFVQRHKSYNTYFRSYIFYYIGISQDSSAIAKYIPTYPEIVCAAFDDLYIGNKITMTDITCLVLGAARMLRIGMLSYIYRAAPTDTKSIIKRIILTTAISHNIPKLFNYSKFLYKNNYDELVSVIVGDRLYALNNIITADRLEIFVSILPILYGYHCLELIPNIMDTILESGAVEIFKHLLDFVINNSIEIPIKYGQMNSSMILYVINKNYIQYIEKDNDERLICYIFREKSSEPLITAILNSNTDKNKSYPLAEFCLSYLNKNRPGILQYIIDKGCIEGPPDIVNVCASVCIINAHVLTQNGYNVIGDLCTDIDGGYNSYIYINHINYKNELLRAITNDDTVLLNRLYTITHPTEIESYMMHGSISMNCINCIHKLLDLGVDVNIPDKNGNPPIITALRVKNIDIIDLLISRGAYLYGCYGITSPINMLYSRAYDDIRNQLMTKKIILPPVDTELTEVIRGLILNKRDISKAYFEHSEDPKQELKCSMDIGSLRYVKTL